MLFYQASNVFVRLSIQNPYKYLHDKKKLYKKVQTINRVKLLKTNEMRQNFFRWKRKETLVQTFKFSWSQKCIFGCSCPVLLLVNFSNLCGLIGWFMTLDLILSFINENWKLPIFYESTGKFLNEALAYGLNSLLDHAPLLEEKIFQKEQPVMGKKTSLSIHIELDNI